MKKFLPKIFKSKNFIFLIVFLLFLSFTVHTLQIQHDHPPGMVGDGVQAVTMMHSEDKKLWLTLLALSFFFTGNGILNAFINIYRRVSSLSPRIVFYIRFVFPKLYDPIQIGLAEGLIHPKIFE